MTKMLFDRRLFLGSSLAGATLLASGCSPSADQSAASAAAGGIAARPYDGKLGVQLYTLRNQFEADFRATLTALAEIGYKDLEFAGYFEHDPAEIRAVMDELGLMSQSSHVPLPAVRENLSQVIDIAGIMGQKFLVIPWIQEDMRNADGYREIAELMNTAGEQANAAGLKIAYHNHEFEFDDLGDGLTGLDILIDNTDPALCAFELDFFWTAVAGADALALLSRAPGRFVACHIKDRTASGDMVAVGEGAIDWQSRMAKAEEIGMQAFYVEHDNPLDPLASVRSSYDYLMG